MVKYLIILYTDGNCDYRDLNCIDFKIIDDVSGLDRYFMDNFRNIINWLDTLYMRFNETTCKNYTILSKIIYDDYVCKHDCFEYQSDEKIKEWISEHTDSIKIIFVEFKNSDYLKFVEI